VCGLQHACGDEEYGFLGSTSKPRSMICQWFGLKTVGTVFSDLTSKPLGMVFSGLPSKLVVTVSPGLVSKLMVSFLVEPQNQGGGGFPCLDLKIGSYSVVIWASKSPRRFFGSGLKTKQVMVCCLYHKTDGRSMAWDTRQDLEACFTWKQVGLGFNILPQDWQRCNDGWCMRYHYGGCVESKLKTDGSIRWAASDPATLALPFSFY
jgi:hypothetical protein